MLSLAPVWQPASADYKGPGFRAVLFIHRKAWDFWTVRLPKALPTNESSLPVGFSDLSVGNLVAERVVPWEKWAILLIESTILQIAWSRNPTVDTDSVHIATEAMEHAL